jgi:hypothetical protein
MALALFLLACHADDCVYTSNCSQRIIQTDSCLSITNSRFEGVSWSTGDGGAIYAGTTCEATLISDTTFVDCSAPSWLSDGGACSLSSGKVDFTRCCGKGCYSQRNGQFLYGKGSTSTSILSSTFVTCGPATHTGYRGCLYLQNIVDARLDFDNFTACYLEQNGGGTSLYLADHTLVLFSYLSVVGCSEGSAIEDQSPGGIRIEFANFYENTVTKTDIGLLRADEIGMNLTNCIFSGNVCHDQELWFRGPPTSPFVLNNCVFADGFPAFGQILGATTGTDNVGSGPVTSLPLPHLDVPDCPHAADVPLPTAAPSTGGATPTRGIGIALR